MSIFALQEIQEIKGRITFYCLLQNGVNLFEEFLDELIKNK